MAIGAPLLCTPFIFAFVAAAVIIVCLINHFLEKPPDKTIESLLVPTLLTVPAFIMAYGADIWLLSHLQDSPVKNVDLLNFVGFFLFLPGPVVLPGAAVVGSFLYGRRITKNRERGRTKGE